MGQSTIYKQWKRSEPFMLALARWRERLGKKVSASRAAVAAGAGAYAYSLKELVRLALGRESDDQRRETQWDDYQAAVNQALYLKLSADNARHQKNVEGVKLFRSHKEEWDRDRREKMDRIVNTISGMFVGKLKRKEVN